ncbi:MAG TPA: helix-turn-helix domain-containing protein [Candidatus Sulfomarinibacteraceae bacterium]|nr:helix-turn-helix domain-containing protein [Candidatus Sulfomarinibacteraceae bacterium]
MTEEPRTATEEWLPLGKAAQQLNVHPTTLRRWADNGEIPVMLTPGGHRRFAASDLATFASERRSLRHVNNLEQMWANAALTQTRQEITTHQDERWLASFDEEVKSRHRQLGQRLMGLTLRYISDDDGEPLLQEARQIGREYANIALDATIPLTEAVQAAMFFRDTLVETALHLPEDTHVRPQASLRLLRRINRLLNVVQLAIAEVYDAYYTDSVPRS